MMGPSGLLTAVLRPFRFGHFATSPEIASRMMRKHVVLHTTLCRLAVLALIGLLPVSGVLAQTPAGNETAPITGGALSQPIDQGYRDLADIARDLDQYRDVQLHDFSGRDDFLATIDKTLGLKNIQNADRVFAKLPRSPFAVVGRHIAKGQEGRNVPCQIFIPDALLPKPALDIFAHLMHGWFGPHLHYASSPGLSYRWLMHHELRHCDAQHFSNDAAQQRKNEIDADLFALNSLKAAKDPADHKALARDIVDFRIITAALFAAPSHMTGISLKRAIDDVPTANWPAAKDEIAAFSTARHLVFARAKSLAAGKAKPSNHDVVRAIITLAHTTDPDHAKSNRLVQEILVDLGNAIRDMAPRFYRYNLDKTGKAPTVE